VANYFPYIKNFRLSSIKNIFKPARFSSTLPVQDVITSPTRISRPEHTLSRRKISQAALNVLYQLHKAGYQAFLVGGSVRDVLLGRAPKDFDVVTNALPEQVKGLFRNCRLIGRRFVLAHVRLHHEIVEVATFRAHHDKGGGGVMEDGRIVRDNVYGTIDEDAWRRDFTINALYYDISDFSLLDYANGLEDLQAGMIRLIGNPTLRYQEDPVRMLRAARFAAKLGFTIAPQTAKPIHNLGGLLANIPPARLFEEVLKLFLGGYALQSFIQLRQYELFKQLFPHTQACLDDPLALTLIEQALHNTDERKTYNKPVAPAFLLAALLWAPLSRLLPDEAVKGTNLQEIWLEASQYILAKQQRHVAIPRRITVLMQEIWLLQLRLTRQRKSKKKSLSVIEHPRFRAGFDFLLLRANAGEEQVVSDVDWWRNFLNSEGVNYEKSLSQRPASKSRRKRSRQRRSE
jgi:poly(A) polymerase